MPPNQNNVGEFISLEEALKRYSDDIEDMNIKRHEYYDGCIKEDLKEATTIIGHLKSWGINATINEKYSQIYK